MELTAVIKALEALTRPVKVEIYSDSSYVVRGMNEWLPNWIRKGWKRSKGTLENVDLWKQLAEVAAKHRVTWIWVKGHAGHPLNERADQLATQKIGSV